MILAINDTPQTVHVNVLYVTLLIGTVLPLLVGVVTKVGNRYKVLMLIVLNGISAALVKAQLPDGGAVFTGQTAIAALLGIMSSLVAYKGAWSPVGLTNNPAHNPDGKALLGPDKGI